MNIGWPEGIWLALAALSLVIMALANGLPRTGNHSFAGTLANVLLVGILLYWGGFFA
jgi:hypothetical protein